VKGFFDRVFLPGFAFKYRPNSVLWDKLLSGRSARVVITMDGPVWYYRFLAGAPGWQIMNRSILGFCGFKPIVPLFIGKVRSLSEKDRLLWISRLNALGMKGE
jgi:putative NADPH-quinone reductase